LKKQQTELIFIVLSFLILLPLTVNAETPDSESDVPLHLTMSKAIELALAHSEQILIADQSIEEAEGVYREYAADAFPQLSGSVSYTRNLERLYTEQDMTMLNPLFAQFGLPELEVEKVYYSNLHEWDFRLTLTQNIFTFGKVSNALKLGDISRKLARQGREVTEQDVILKTKQAFLSVLYAREVLAVANANLQRTQENYNTIKAKVDQGIMSRFDLLVMEAELAAAKPPVLEAQNMVNLTTQALLNVIGEPLDRPVDVVGKLLFTSLQADRQTLITRARQNRPELRLLEMQQDLYDTSYRLFRATYFPTLAANASASRTGGTDKRIWPEDPDDTLQPTLSFGVQLYVPLFDGLRGYGQMKQMQAKKRTAQLEYQMLLRGIELEITSLVDQVHLSEQVHSANREAYRVAEEAYKLAQLRFENGLSTRLEVTEAKTNLNRAALGVATSLYNLHIARAQLQRALGE